MGGVRDGALLYHVLSARLLSLYRFFRTRGQVALSALAGRFFHCHALQGACRLIAGDTCRVRLLEKRASSPGREKVSPLYRGRRGISPFKGIRSERRGARGL